jgi:hypothetical protein
MSRRSRLPVTPSRSGATKAKLTAFEQVHQPGPNPYRFLTYSSATVEVGGQKEGLDRRLFARKRWPSVR